MKKIKKKYLLGSWGVHDDLIKHNEIEEGELTFEKAMSIPGDFFWVTKNGVVAYYCKMRELTLK